MTKKPQHIFTEAPVEAPLFVRRSVPVRQLTELSVELEVS